jgi:membrane associated rhomboid family serine protease
LNSDSEERVLRYRGEWGFQSGITPVVKNLIIANAAIYVVTLLSQGLIRIFGLVPVMFWKGAIWQPLTYMFLHGGTFHLLFNMLVLWMFGSTLEATWGSRKFLKFYLICGAGAGFMNALVLYSSPIPTVGASGAIYGLLMAFAILFPNQLIYIWGIFPVKARYFVIGIGLLELIAATGSTQSNIAHVAHLSGMLFGLVYMKWADWQKKYSRLQSENKKKRHLKVVWDREQEKRKLQKEADDLLDKINREGIDSLTLAERERLREVGRKIKDLEGY